MPIVFDWSSPAISCQTLHPHLTLIVLLDSFCSTLILSLILDWVLLSEHPCRCGVKGFLLFCWPNTTAVILMSRLSLSDTVAGCVLHPRAWHEKEKWGRKDLTYAAFDKSFIEIPFFLFQLNRVHWSSGGVFAGMLKNVASAVFVFSFLFSWSIL